MRNIMKRAWEIAKKGQKNFGGKASEYLSAALKLAWNEIKKGGSKMLRVVKERAEQIKKGEIELTGGNADTNFAAISQAKVEYSKFMGTVKEINKITGKESVKIDVLLEALETASVEQYLGTVRQMNGILAKLK